VELTILVCPECNKKYIPKKYACPHCLSNELVEEQVEGKGAIFSFTTVRIAPKAFAAEVPYDVILVELENGLHVTARLAEGSAQIGDDVRLKEIKDSVYWFEPEKEGDIID
jgi:uncharacterized OB-fold protein